MKGSNNTTDEQTIFNENYFNKQFALLRFMFNSAGKTKLTNAKYVIKEIATQTNLGDADEVLRLFYILEGQKLVTPASPGDFTSSEWTLTEQGADVAAKLAQHKKVTINDLY